MYQNKVLRNEYKYYINQRDYEVIKKRIAMVTRPDSNSVDGKGYHIRSLYFDDIYNSAYNEKISGAYDRRKYRIRIYNREDSIIKLEKKSKLGSHILKESVGINKEQYYMFLNGTARNASELNKPNDGIIAEILREMRLKRLVPRVIVDYHREAFTFWVEDVRITIDQNLHVGSSSLDIFDPNLVTAHSIHSPTYILEVKFNRYLPVHIKNMLQISPNNRQAISKYVICRYDGKEIFKK